ncbi:MAG: HtaA domain-containing protein [Solirubrobacterales bacterium]|nr:HtaA domain-containing protein [Solirubrobacterales bacterium]HMT06197.1 HtaA domain-containing protein [Solirubrobacterales bacterium]
MLAAIIGSLASPVAAGAATLKPCESTGSNGPKAELAGQLSLAPSRATRRAWRRSGLSQSLIKPASGLTGRPTFNVAAAKYGKSTAKVTLKGGIRLSRGKRSFPIRRLQVFAPAGKPALLRARVGRSFIAMFKVKGGKRSFNAREGELSRVGIARLTVAGARVINRKLDTAPGKLRAGTAWGYFNLYSLYKLTEGDGPTGEVPEIPPVKTEPAGADKVTTAATIKWYVRDTFIDYVASGVGRGDGVYAEGGATTDAPSGPDNLVYSFNFPFSSGWTVPETVGSPENSLIKASGTVGFRFCRNTINFTVADPEVEINGDRDSRLIFHVNGTDGTAFPNQRAVMVKLLPSRAQSHNVTPLGGNEFRVSYEKIPGFIPAEATGVFAGFYPAYRPDFEGQDPRPDRFGFFSIAYDYTTVP